MRFRRRHLSLSLRDTLSYCTRHASYQFHTQDEDDARSNLMRKHSCCSSDAFLQYQKALVRLTAAQSAVVVLFFFDCFSQFFFLINSLNPKRRGKEFVGINYQVRIEGWRSTCRCYRWRCLIRAPVRRGAYTRVSDSLREELTFRRLRSSRNRIQPSVPRTKLLIKYSNLNFIYL